MTSTERPLFFALPRTAGAWTGADAVAYAGSTITFVLTGVRE